MFNFLFCMDIRRWKKHNSSPTSLILAWAARHVDSPSLGLSCYQSWKEMWLLILFSVCWRKWTFIATRTCFNNRAESVACNFIIIRSVFKKCYRDWQHDLSVMRKLGKLIHPCVNKVMWKRSVMNFQENICFNIMLPFIGIALNSYVSE